MEDERLTKKGILSWHSRALKSLDARIRKRHALDWYLNQSDVEAYKRSIAHKFEELKKRFNKQLKEGQADD